MTGEGVQHSQVGLLQLVQGRLKEAILKLDPELEKLSESELRHRMRPSPTDHSLRVSFWREFDEAILQKRPMKQSHIYKGICTEPYWYSKFLYNPKKIAWLIKPLQSYEREIEALLHRGGQRLWEIMNMDITDPKYKRIKRICPRRAKVLMEAIAMVENRARGMAVQRQHQRVEAVSVKAEVQPHTFENLDDHIKELEASVKPIVVDPNAETIREDDGEGEGSLRGAAST